MQKSDIFYFFQVSYRKIKNSIEKVFFKELQYSTESLKKSQFIQEFDVFAVIFVFLDTLITKDKTNKKVVIEIDSESLQKVSG